MYLSTPQPKSCPVRAPKHLPAGGTKIFHIPDWVKQNIPSHIRGMGQSASSASLATVGLTAGIGAALNVASAIASYMLQSAAQRDDTTNLTNYAAQMLTENSQAYNSCQISASEAQSNFNTIWAWLVQQCSNPAFGTAGGSCIQERQAGGEYDWFKLYYDTYSNPPSSSNYVGAAGYGTTPSACTYSGASTSAGTTSGCLSLLSLFGISEPCLGPIGMYSAAGLALIAFLVIE